MNLSDVKEVRVVSVYRATDLQDCINDRLKEGWLLLSEPQIAPLHSNSTRDTRYFVTLYKPKQESL